MVAVSSVLLDKNRAKQKARLLLAMCYMGLLENIIIMLWQSRAGAFFYGSDHL